MRILESWFNRPELLGWLALLPFVPMFWVWVEKRRRSAARLWTGSRTLSSVSYWRRWLRYSSLVWVLALITVGAAGPLWGRDPQTPAALGRDILVVLDISRSMLAEDPPRSRLDRAKDYLHEWADYLQRRGGYRVGLIGFAGRARLLCPLTNDYDHFRFVVEQAHPDRLKPTERLGAEGLGTQLAHALSLALENLDPDFEGYREILVISDGDDLASDWRIVAERASTARVPVHALGIGDPATKVRIPVDGGYLQFQGEFVTTQRQDKVLQDIASATGGTYLPEESTPQPAVHWFRNQIEPLPIREWTTQTRSLATHRFSWFFVGAIILLMVEMMLGDGVRRSYHE